VRRDLHQDVAGFGLCVLDEHIEIPVVREDAGVQQFVLGRVRVATRVLRHQIRIGIGAMRILVQHLQVGMRRRRVQVEVVLLDVLAVVAFGIGQAEQSLLQNRIATVPKPERQADQLVGVAETREPVLTPAIGAAARVVVREIVPGRAVGAVILPYRAPLAFAQVRAPMLPASRPGWIRE
jgi:hypothetical protein